MSDAPDGTKPASEYLFVEVATQRCLQLMRGAAPKLNTGARKYTTLAVQEVSDGLVPWKVLEVGSPELETFEAIEREDPLSAAAFGVAPLIAAAAAADAAPVGVAEPDAAKGATPAEPGVSAASDSD